MKAIFKLAFAFVALLSFAACSDVPMPYEQPGTNNDDDKTDSVTTVAKGTGTQADPYNVTAALEVVSALASGEETPTAIYVKGAVKEIKQIETAQYGNANYYITDDGNNQIYIFQSYYLGNRKFTADDKLEVGDTVVVCGKFTNYQGNTPETVGKGSSYIYSLNGKTAETTPDTPDTPDTGVATGDGTEANPFNSVAANKYAATLDDNAESDKNYYIKGKVVSVKEEYSKEYGNATFYISDDGKADNQFYVYRALYLNNEKYTSGTNIKAGDEVVICGKITKYVSTYGTTYETVQNKAYLVSLKSNGGESSGDDKGDSGDATAANGDFENWSDGLPNNWKTSSTAGNATLSQSTEAHGGKYSVKVTGTTSANKRLGYKETTLKAGEYTMTFYAKAASSTGGSVRPGYVPVTDGKVGSYVYGNYVNGLSTSEWTKVTHTFTISEDGTYCLVIMNSKSPGGDVLIDDFTLTLGSTTVIK